MLIDELMPDPDAARAEHLVIQGSTDRVYEAALEADFARAFDEARIARLATSLRSAVEAAVARLRRRPSRDPGPAEELKLAGLGSHGQYVLLGADAPREIAFGMIGRFWVVRPPGSRSTRPSSRTSTVPGTPGSRATFPFGSTAIAPTSVSYETRTRATDPDSRRAFLRYWRVAGPLAGFVLRSQLALIATVAAERSARSAGSIRRSRPASAPARAE